MKKNFVFLLVIMISSLQVQGEVHTLILCGKTETFPFAIQHLDSMDSKVEVNKTVQRKIDLLRELNEYVFLSIGLRSPQVRESYVVSDHGVSGVKNFIINKDFIDVYHDVLRKLKNIQTKSQTLETEKIIAQANEEEITMQIVIPGFQKISQRYKFKNVYDCFESGRGEMIKTTFTPSYDFYHNFNYPSNSEEERHEDCSCHVVRM